MDNQIINMFLFGYFIHTFISSQLFHLRVKAYNKDGKLENVITCVTNQMILEANIN